MKPWVLVTPASRGIGFALTRYLLRTTKAPIIATARNELGLTKARLLDSIPSLDPSRLDVQRLDVTEEQTIRTVADSCEACFGKSGHLHLAFAIPGILLDPEKHYSNIDAEDALRTFRVNTIGPMLLVKHFGKFLPKKSTQSRDEFGGSNEDVYKGLNPDLAIWANMSARVGSISDNELGGWYSYRASKAAVNQVVRTFDNSLRIQSGDKAMAVGLHPGTVKTDLSKEFWSSTRPEKLFEPDWIAERLVGLLTTGLDGKGIRIGARGRCWDWDGKEISP